ncbi:unnamed protein product [Amoebophrya sp. A25]|nr:unnamed protein product [Amoebophrya sp. A25]|eukprot:GSA25T00002187001.1
MLSDTRFASATEVASATSSDTVFTQAATAEGKDWSCQQQPRHRRSLRRNLLVTAMASTCLFASTLVTAQQASQEELGANAELYNEFEDVLDVSSKNGNKTSEEVETETDWSLADKMSLQHCFLTTSGGEDNKVDSSCFERGTLLLLPTAARIEDDPNFEKMRDTEKLRTLVESCQYYSIELTPAQEDGAASTSSSVKMSLKTSIPCSLLNVEDQHDSLEVSLTSRGKVLGINYRTQPAWGLNLFEHTAVRLNKGLAAPAPVIPPRPVIKEGEQEQLQDNSIFGMLRRYWWVILIVFVIMNVMGGMEDPGK